MTTYIRKILIIALSIVFLFNQQLVDGVVAIVGDNVILQSEVYQNAQLQAMNDKIDLSSNRYLMNSYLEKSLDLIIQQYVIFEYAKNDTNIILDESEVNITLEQQIDAMIANAGSEEDFEAAIGQSVRAFKKDYYEDLYKLMLIDRYQQSFMYDITITREEVENFYETYKDSLPVSDPASKYSVIEVPVQPGKQADSLAFEFMSSLLDSILNGADFADLAKKYSYDKGSADSGGELGLIRRGNLVKEFEEAAFSLEVGEISKPVKTEYGYHIIQLEEKQGEKIRARHILYPVKPTEEDKESARKIIRQAYFNVTEEGIPFDTLAVSFAQQYKNRSGVYPLTPHNMIERDILSHLTEMNENTVSYPFESDYNSLVILYLHEFKPEKQPSLEDSWSFIEQLALQKKTSDEFEKWVNELKKSTFIKIF